jgi:hypothetical protein
MRLFTVREDYQVDLNKDWLYLIPEFAELIRRDKGSKGDYRGDRKLKARREFTFIYFDLDFTSPIREYGEWERREEAMKYADLKESDLDAAVMAAHAKYNELLNKSARSLKTLKAVEKSLDALDSYFEDVDFTKVDKKGELVHTPNQYLGNIERLDKAYTSIERFRKRVEEELKGDSSIRGTATLGGKEGKRVNWEEVEPTAIVDTAERVKPTNMKDLAAMLHGENNLLKEEREDDE